MKKGIKYTYSQTPNHLCRNALNWCFYCLQKYCEDFPSISEPQWYSVRRSMSGVDLSNSIDAPSQGQVIHSQLTPPKSKVSKLIWAGMSPPLHAIWATFSLQKVSKTIWAVGFPPNGPCPKERSFFWDFFPYTPLN